MTTLTPIKGLPPGMAPASKALQPIEGLPPGYGTPSLQGPDYATIPLEQQYGSLKPTAIERLGRGFTDLGQGVQQLVRGDEYDAKVSEEIKRYDRYAGDGIDVPRIVGQALPAVPVAMAAGAAGVPAYLASKGVPTWLVAGLGGATEAGALAVTDEGSRLNQALAGGAGGVAGYKLMQGLQKIGGKVMSYLGKRVDVGEAERIVREAVDSSGVDYNALDDHIKKALTDDVHKALDVGMAADEVGESAARRATLEAEGLTPTAGRVTRDPKLFSKEDNLMKLDGVGEPLLDIRRGNLDQLQARAGEIAEGVSAPTTPYEAGKGLIDEVAEVDALYRQGENEVYKAAREAAGGDVYVPRENLKATLDDMLGTFTPEEISPPLVKQFQQYIDEDSLFTVDLAERDLQRLNQLIGGGDKQRKMLAGRLARAIKDDLAEVGKEGEGAAARWREARKFASDRRGMADPVASRRPEILGSILDSKIKPMEVVNKVRNADPKELESLMSYLSTGPAATRDGSHKAIGRVRRAVVDSIYEKVMPQGAEGGFNGARLQKELRKIGPERMKILFPGSEAELSQLAKAAIIEGYAPPLNSINRSNSGTFLTDMMRQALRFPIGVEQVADLVKTRVGRAGVKQATRNTLGLPARGASNALSAAQQNVAVGTGLITGAALGGSTQTNQ